MVSGELAGEGLQTGFSRHGLPPQRAPLDTVYPLRKHLNSVQRMVSGGYCEGLFPDTVCWTRLRNTWLYLFLTSAPSGISNHGADRAHTKGVVQQRTLLRRVLEIAFEKVLTEGFLEAVLQCVLQGGSVLRRVLRRGSKKGLSRRRLEGGNTPFREYDPVGVRLRFTDPWNNGLSRVQGDFNVIYWKVQILLCATLTESSWSQRIFAA